MYHWAPLICNHCQSWTLIIGYAWFIHGCLFSSLICKLHEIRDHICLCLSLFCHRLLKYEYNLSDDSEYCGVSWSSFWSILIMRNTDINLEERVDWTEWPWDIIPTLYFVIKKCLCLFYINQFASIIKAK